MRTLSETASTLTIDQPMWIGLATLAVGYALAIWFIRGARKSKKPMQKVAAGIFALVLVSALGGAMLLDNIAMDATGASETHWFTTAQSAAWKNVVEVKVEERKSGKRGMQPHLVLKQAPPYREMAVDISRLDRAEMERVVAFAKARAGK